MGRSLARTMACNALYARMAADTGMAGIGVAKRRHMRSERRTRPERRHDA
jgi:hypothetical protein